MKTIITKNNFLTEYLHSEVINIPLFSNLIIISKELYKNLFIQYWNNKFLLKKI